MANRPSHRRDFNGSADFQRDDCSGPYHPEEDLDLQPSSSEVGHVTEDFNQYSSEIRDGTENLFGLDQSSSGTRDIIEDWFDIDLWSRDRQDEVTDTTETSFERDSLLYSAPSATRDQDAWIALDDKSETTEGTVVAAASDPLAIPFVNQPMRGENLDPQLYPTSEDIDIDVSDPDSQDVDQAQCPSRRRLDKQAVKRERTLPNPEETARTRLNKACLSCKIQKTRSWGIGNRVPLLISRCTNAGNASLLVHGCEFTELGPNLFLNRLVGFARGEGPSDEDLYSWAKRDIEQRAEAHKNFPNCLEKFHLLYEQMFHQRYVADVKGSDQTRPGKFHKLMDNAQHVACMAKTWATEQFSVLGVPFGANAEPLSIFLQQRVAKIIPPIEGQILEQLKAFSIPKETKITNDLESTMGSALVIAVWAALWQMMLTYRSVLKWTLPGTG
ncbi:hypothetical protein N0V85_006833 [Neurospora sp. IMI 360204]|nr:hypothetical protein N0V85_006833 [Neurospora sp. IMI 360204]